MKPAICSNKRSPFILDDCNGADEVAVGGMPTQVYSVDGNIIVTGSGTHRVGLALSPDILKQIEDTGWIDLQAHSDFAVEGVLKMRVLSGVLYLVGTDIRFIGEGLFGENEIFRIPSEFELPFVIEFPATFVAGWGHPMHASIRITKDGIANIATTSPSIYGHSVTNFNTSIPLGEAPNEVQYGYYHNDTAWFIGDLDDD